MAGLPEQAGERRVSTYRLTTVNRLGEGRSVIFDTPEEAWSAYDAANRNTLRYISLIDLHHGRVMALIADGGVVPQRSDPAPTTQDGEA